VSASPVDEALARAAADMPRGDRDEFQRLMRAGLAEIDPVVGPDDLAIEIDAAVDVPPGDRLAAARRFAADRRAFSLGRRSGELLTAFSAGQDVAAQAAALLTRITAAIDGGGDDDILRELGSYATECRYILSGGTGPTSLRGAKLT
jgi:hypothetical protein